MTTSLLGLLQAPHPGRAPRTVDRPVDRTAPPMPADPVEIEAIAPIVELASFEAELARQATTARATLIVQRRGPESFSIQAADHTGEVAPVTAHDVERPRVALGELASPSGRTATEVMSLMRNWSRTLDPSLQDWLRRLRETAADDDIRLVIWDQTGFEVPWELLYLRRCPSGGPAGWLGSLLPVTRRVTIFPDDEGDWDPHELEDHVARGAVLASFDDAMAGDHAAFGSLTFTPIPDADLLVTLRSATAALGLVYLAYHGLYGDSILDLELGPLRLRNLDDTDFPGVRTSHAVVFLNACHSGRMLYDTRLATALFGWSEAFLRRGAIAVIGTTGEVDGTIAAGVAYRILAAVRDHPRVPLARVLRDVRRIVAAAVDLDEPAAEDLERFFYVFMYVLYGNPDTCLELPASDPAPGEIAAGDT